MTSGGVVHIINTLGQGGAEMMLMQLIEETLTSTPTAMVIGLGHDGIIGARIREMGVPVVTLDMGPRSFALESFRVGKLIRSVRPDVVQTWLYHANLIGGLAAKRAGAPVVWGIHHTNLANEHSKWTTRAVAKSGAVLSRRLPGAIVCCAESSRAIHLELGYAREKMIVIPNGFDMTRFSPDPEAPRRLRERIGAPSNARVAGLLARFHPMKDHRNFVRAAAIAAASDPALHFVLCGVNVDWDNEALTGWIEATGLKERFHLLGAVPDPWNVQAGLDVGILSSVGGEAFPLTVGESMACGVPCAVTDVGDAALMVSGAGRVVPTSDPAALAGAVTELLRLPPVDRARVGCAARRKIETEFSLPAVAHRYEAVWRRIASAPR